MGSALDTAKFVLDVVKAGQPTVNVARNRVTVLPQGTTKRDLPGPWQRSAVTEYLREYSMLGEYVEELGLPGGRTIDYAVTVAWDYDGQYISEFHVSASGTVQVFSNLDITVETFEATYDSDDVVEMNYDIVCTISNLTGGSKRLVIHAQARGDGGGMSLGID